MTETGWKHSEETKRKMSEAHKGINTWSKGRKLSEEHRLKISEKCKGGNKTSFKKGNIGPKCVNWQGGKTPELKRLRNSLDYKLWRTAVFERDNYTCIWCGAHGAYLEADHIKPFALFPELRFAIDNGRTLCKPCHKTTPTYGHKCITNAHQNN